MNEEGSARQSTAAEFLDQLGGIVAYKDAGSQHWALSSWCGETVHALVRLDVTDRPPIGLLREHIIEAVPMAHDDDVPDGWLGVIAFKNAG
jgi:hypothetical protein